MVLFEKKPKTWPYAADSVGKPRGPLPVGGRFGTLQCFEACGSARAEFNKFMGDIKSHLENNLSRAPDREMVITLMMVGRQAERTKPYVLISSDDRPLRIEAFRSIKNESGIMKDHPGFEIGHIPLESEFTDLKNLQALADGASSSASVSVCGSENAPVELAIGKGGNATCRKLHLQSDNDEQSKARSATAGGLVSYGNQLMFLTVNHLLEESQRQIHPDFPVQEPTQDEESDECEITGLSDFEDDDETDLVDITSRGSVSPASEAGDSAASDTIADELSTLSSGVEHTNHAELLRSRLEALSLSIPPMDEMDVAVSTGEVVASSKQLDYALVRVAPSSFQRLGLDTAEAQSQIIPLENYMEHIEPKPRDAAVRTTTPEGGTIGGTLLGSTSLFCPPGSKKFVEVYTARLNRPLVPGECGSSVRDAISGKTYGHIVAGSPTTGIALIVPAQHVFDDALARIELQKFVLRPIASARIEPASIDDEGFPIPPISFYNPHRSSRSLISQTAAERLGLTSLPSKPGPMVLNRSLSFQNFADNDTGVTGVKTQLQAEYAQLQAEYVRRQADLARLQTMTRAASRDNYQSDYTGGHQTREHSRDRLAEAAALRDSERAAREDYARWHCHCCYKPDYTHVLGHLYMSPHDSYGNTPCRRIGAKVFTSPVRIRTGTPESDWLLLEYSSSTQYSSLSTPFNRERQPGEGSQQQRSKRLRRYSDPNGFGLATRLALQRSTFAPAEFNPPSSNPFRIDIDSIHVANENCGTPLLLAVQQGNVELVQRLLQQRAHADVDAQGWRHSSNQTPLSLNSRNALRCGLAEERICAGGARSSSLHPLGNRLSRSRPCSILHARTGTTSIQQCALHFLSDISIVGSNPAHFRFLARS